MEETGCEIICGAQTTLAFKGLMRVMMMTLYVRSHPRHHLSRIPLFMPIICGYNFVKVCASSIWGAVLETLPQNELDLVWCLGHVLF